AHGLPPAMPELTHEADHLVPAKDLLHAFALALADLVARMPRRPPVDRTPLAPRMHVGTDVGRHVAAAEGVDEGVDVVALVGSHGAPTGAGLETQIGRASCRERV